MTDQPTPLVDLLGDSRAKIVDLLRRRARTTAELAGALDISDVGVRKHLRILEDDGLVEATTVRREGPGRPSHRYELTDKARRLYPDRSAELANELMEFMEATYGRKALLAFMRWRQSVQQDRYANALDGLDSTQERAEALAELLSDDGFLSEVGIVSAPEGATVLELKQGHCAIQDVAEAHPEVCAYEAALFKRLLGAKLSRRQTIAGGANTCICHIEFDENDHDTTSGAEHVDQS